MNSARLVAALAALVVLTSCGRIDDPSDVAATSEDALTHTSDLASHMPDHLAIMHVMSWFGIPASNKLAPGKDPKWGNWSVGPFKCVTPKIVTDFDSNGDHDISSRYHPLAGIYSSTGADGAESIARIKLVLSNARSDCDDSARIDAFAIQLDGTHYSSLRSGGSNNEEIPLESLKAYFAEADAEGRTNVVMPSDDATWYWNNGALDCEANQTNHNTCVTWLTQDVEDMVNLAKSHPSAVRIPARTGKLLLHFYMDTATGFPTVTEWQTIFSNARAATGVDFYTLGSHTHPSYFAAFDALSPWVSPGPNGWWHATSGSSVYTHAQAYATALHKELLQETIPEGHVVFGNVAAGFDDWTQEWGQCVQRQIPTPDEGSPRDTDVVRGTVDYLKAQKYQPIKGLLISTWDDWTEGSFFEPSVEEGTKPLVTLRQELGSLYNDTQSAAGDAALTARWTGYGKTFPASGGEGSYHPPDMCESTTPPPPPPGCDGPAILEPTAGESVGPYIRLRVQGGTCLNSTIAYLDNVNVAQGTDTIDQWIPVSMGHHTLHVNAWEANGTLHQGAVDVSFTRTY